MTLPTGVRLGLDWGKARIGVAACDREGLLAYPVATLPGTNWWQPLKTLIAEYEPTALIVGLPRSLSGDEGPSAAAARSFAEELAVRLEPLPVGLADERLTTVDATQRLRAAGRSARQQRGIVDQAAAVAILEAVLAAERRGRQIVRRVLVDEDGER